MPCTTSSAPSRARSGLTRTSRLWRRCSSSWTTLTTVATRCSSTAFVLSFLSISFIKSHLVLTLHHRITARTSLICAGLCNRHLLQPHLEHPWSTQRTVLFVHPDAITFFSISISRVCCGCHDTERYPCTDPRHTRTSRGQRHGSSPAMTTHIFPFLLLFLAFSCARVTFFFPKHTKLSSFLWLSPLPLYIGVGCRERCQNGCPVPQMERTALVAWNRSRLQRNRKRWSAVVETPRAPPNR